MSPAVFAAVIAAAAMHAIWNAMVKVHLDRFVSVTLMTLGMAVPALLIAPFVTFPALEVWPYILASAAFHQGYKLSLIKGYAVGDLAQVYPLARGTAPLLTTIGAMVLIAEIPGAWTMLGIALLCAGTVLMSLRGGGLEKLNASAVGFALATSFFIACYTLSDGTGARTATDAASYAVWLYLTDALVSLALVLARRGAAVLPVMARAWRAGLITGLLSAAAYLIAMWAMTKAPIGAVAALRETSILFALAISVLFLGEKLSFWRILSGLLIVAGVVALRLA
ncbi:EamA family transporter [Tianweitania sediminis]|uniref:EamA family transporter n=1 Tax=Tianweitania sediminis TaxID=1502156 RepID=A0A8J7UIW7_9HYPH|nr:EamA family transporter [Tianweitania sediminis]MBP0438240.1 EamA family transporter [Tianweitania sediminis]